MSNSKTLSNKDYLKQLPNQYYIGIFEFAQASFPRTVWENEVKLFKNLDDFRQYIINTPQNITAASSKEPPIFYRSSFQGIFFLALLFQIPDSQARGFSRPYVLAIAHKSKESINYLYYIHQNQFIQLIAEIQRRPCNLFPIEIVDYAISLKHLLANSTDHFGLDFKMEELQQLLPIFGITDLPDKPPIYNDPDYFLRIKSDLRDFETFTDVNLVIPKIEELIKRISSSEISINIIHNSPTESTGKSLQDSYDILSDKTSYIMNISTPIPDFFSSDILTNSLYSLLSGQSLAIFSSDISLSQIIASKLSICTPFFKPFSIEICDKSQQIEPHNASIYIFSYEDELFFKNPAVSVLNLNTMKFIGNPCPSGSILSKELSIKGTNLSNKSTFILLFNNLKNLGNKFLLKIADISQRSEISKESLFEVMNHIGFCKCDENLIMFWMMLISES